MHSDKKILGGKPVIKGTRLAVEFIIDLLAHGWSEAEILENYPGIVVEDIQACLAYASATLHAGRKLKEESEMNLTVELTTNQVVGFVQQMPPEERRTLLLAIAEQAAANREARIDHAEAQFRQLCTDRGLDWDAMTEAEARKFR